MKSVDRDVLENTLNSILDPNPIADYCPNGLQIEGVNNICKLITGVTASKALIDLAVDLQADAILVHHGVFWKGDPQVLKGYRKERLQSALSANLNIYAYHLPLDVHPELGNNTQLASLLGWPLRQVVGPKGLVNLGELKSPEPLAKVVDHVSSTLACRCQVAGVDDMARPIRKLAWCTGAAAGYIEEAAMAGADLFLTGELSEPAVHIASELGVSLVGAGHHATERCGVQALGQWIHHKFGIDVQFHDLFVAV